MENTQFKPTDAACKATDRSTKSSFDDLSSEVKKQDTEEFEELVRSKNLHKKRSSELPAQLQGIGPLIAAAQGQEEVNPTDPDFSLQAIGMPSSSGPLHSAMVAQTEAVSGSSLTIPQIQEIGDQIIDTITLLNTQHVREMRIQLQHVPHMEGIEIIITEYTTAPAQYNIAFQEVNPSQFQLLQQAGLLLEGKDHNPLREQLSAKGFEVHQITLSLQDTHTSPTYSKHPDYLQQQHSQQDPRDGQQHPQESFQQD